MTNQFGSIKQQWECRAYAFDFVFAICNVERNFALNGIEKDWREQRSMLIVSAIHFYVEKEEGKNFVGKQKKLYMYIYIYM